MLLSERATIDAPPEAVFGVMADFSSYHLWNPWIVAVEGDCKAGNTVTVTVDMGGKRQTVRHRVERVEAPDCLQWSDIGWFTMLAMGYRTRYLSRLPQGRTDYRVELSITGPLAWLVRRLYGKSLSQGLYQEAQALKSRTEKHHER